MAEFVQYAVIVFAVVFILGQQIIGSIAWLRGNRPQYAQKRVVTVGELTLRFLGYLFLSVWAHGGPFQQPFTWVPQPVRLLGLPLMVAGLAIALVAHHQLGQYWIPGVGVYKGHQLVTRGLYHRIRHPLYAGLSLGFIGIAVLGASKATTLFAGCMMLALLYRVHIEEFVMRGYFRANGRLAAYDAYLNEVPILIPFVHFRLPRSWQRRMAGPAPQPRPPAAGSRQPPAARRPSQPRRRPKKRRRPRTKRRR